MNKQLICSLAIGLTLCSSCVSIRNRETERRGSFQDLQVLEKALGWQWQGVDAVPSAKAQTLCEEARKKVQNANYLDAVQIILSGLEKIPKNFKLQYYLAALIGDASEAIEEPLKSSVQQKSKDLFIKLAAQVEQQPKDIYYHFTNEYFFRYARYKDQYELGLKRVADYWGNEQWTKFGVGGYYSQGVGASNYAKELFIKGDKHAAQDYAKKALAAWAQYFSYNNSYYNAYVHYALALGILGFEEDMMRALEHSADIIGKDLTYSEFKEVIDFIKSMH